MNPPNISRELFINRYTRQMMVPEIGIQGQLLLQMASVVVVGAGGLGSSVLLYLAGAGFGRIHIIDSDFVDVGNLHRQVVYSTSSAENIEYKADSARERLLSLNPDINVSVSRVKLSSENALEELSGFSLVIDSTDNFSARYAINDACVALEIPLISGAAVGWEGHITVIVPGKSACYRCLYPSVSDSDSCRTCANLGVVGPVPGIIGCFQAIEAIKMIMHIHSHKRSEGNGIEPLIGRQLFIDGLTGSCVAFDLPSKDIACVVCGENSLSTQLVAISEENQDNHDGNSQGNEEVESIYSDSEDDQVSVSLKNEFPMEEDILSPDPVPLSTINDEKVIESFISVPSITCEEYAAIFFGGHSHVILDVRLKEHYNIISLSEAYLPSQNKFFHGEFAAIPIPASFVVQCPTVSCISVQEINISSKQVRSLLTTENGQKVIFSLLQQACEEFDDSLCSRCCIPVYVICRRGKESKSIVEQLLAVKEFDQQFQFINIEGGLESWKMNVDPQFPMYT